MSIVDNVMPSQQSRALWFSTVAFATCFAVWTITDTHLFDGNSKPHRRGIPIKIPIKVEKAKAVQLLHDAMPVSSRAQTLIRLNALIF